MVLINHVWVREGASVSGMPIGQPVEVISGETVTAREYRETGETHDIYHTNEDRPQGRPQYRRIAVWGDIAPAL